MNFGLTDEQLAFRDAVERFGRDVLVPNWSAEADANNVFLTASWKAMGDFGILGLPFPEEYGGSGTGAVDTCLAGEALGRAGVDAGTTLSMGAHTILCGVPIWKLGTEEQKRRYLPGLSSGDLIGGFCLTEPGSGSDAAGMKTRAVRDGEHWVINGSKTWITNGPVGDVFVVTAVTDPEATPKAFGISTFLIEAGTPGFRVGKKLDKLGCRTSPTSELYFDDMRVPASAMLGPLNMGFALVGKLILGWERTCLMSPALGGLWHGLATASRYMHEREQFGRPLAKFQALQEKIADMRVAYEVSWGLLYRVADLLDRDEPVMVEAAIVKTFLSEASVKMAEEVIQIHGGYGYSKEYLVERAWRDSKVGTIGAGTSEVQRGIIARAMGNF